MSSRQYVEIVAAPIKMAMRVLPPDARQTMRMFERALSALGEMKRDSLPRLEKPWVWERAVRRASGLFYVTAFNPNTGERHEGIGKTFYGAGLGVAERIRSASHG